MSYSGGRKKLSTRGGFSSGPSMVFFTLVSSQAIFCPIYFRLVLEGFLIVIVQTIHFYQLITLFCSDSSLFAVRPFFIPMVLLLCTGSFTFTFGHCRRLHVFSIYLENGFIIEG